MATKPRKPRRSFRDQFDEALANAVIDGGTYSGDEAEARETRRSRGRPPVYAWARIDPVLEWHIANQRLLTLDALAASLRRWLGDDKAPAIKTLEARINQLLNRRR